MALQALQKHAEGLVARVQAARASQELSDEEKARVAQLQSELAECKSALATSKRNAAQLEAEIAALQQQILDSGGAELRLQKGKVEKLANQVDECAQAVTQAQVDMAASKKGIEKAQKVCASRAILPIRVWFYLHFDCYLLFAGDGGC
jgi:structural maintenance of chromosome 4